jgi:hypothetical protein
VEEPYSDGRTVSHALALVKEGMSKDVLYNLFIECFLCGTVVLKCRFPHEHHCPRKLKFQHTELDVTHPIRRIIPRYRAPRSNDDISTDVSSDEDSESDWEIDELLLA